MVRARDVARAPRPGAAGGPPRLHRRDHRGAGPCPDSRWNTRPSPRRGRRRHGSAPSGNAPQLPLQLGEDRGNFPPRLSVSSCASNMASKSMMSLRPCLFLGFLGRGQHPAPEFRIGQWQHHQPVLQQCQRGDRRQQRIARSRRAAAAPSRSSQSETARAEQRHASGKEPAFTGADAEMARQVRSARGRNSVLIRGTPKRGSAWPRPAREEHGEGPQP